MLSRKAFDDLLRELGLTQSEAARLLSVDARTVRRWAENPAEMPGPAEQALLAWRVLNQFGLPWAPGSVDLVKDASAYIAAHRAHSVDLASILKAVKQRGGPAAPWQVDLDVCRATLGPIQVSFQRLANGGFSPKFYRRKDGPPDLQRDWALIEDAFASIAEAIAQERTSKSPKSASGARKSRARTRIY